MILNISDKKKADEIAKRHNTHETLVEALRKIGHNQYCLHRKACDCAAKIAADALRKAEVDV